MRWSRLTILFFVVVVLIAVGLFVWKDGISAVDPSDKTTVMFVVAKGDGVRAIANRLSQQNLIRSPIAFFILVKSLKMDANLQAGDFRLSKSMDAETIAKELTHGIVDAWVTTIEGWRSEEVAMKLNKDLDVPEVEFLKYAKVGYMFPDTYLIPRDATPAAIAELFLKTFNEKISDQMRTDSKKTGLTFDQVITMASIVEREGRTNEDRPLIAGILLKRFNAGWALNADSTLQYALGYQPDQKTWWKQGVNANDKLIRSPYNSYTNSGLPPTPICNPGLASVKAVIYSVPTDYWYYLHDNQGVAHYAKTLEEHNANIVKYLD